MRGPRSCERGYAILLVLWTLALLSLLVAHISAAARFETQFANSLNDSAQLEAAAGGAIQQAIFLTLDRSSRHWHPDNIARTIQIGHVSVAVRVEDEADKVNPNFAPPSLVAALLVQIGADRVTATTVAHAIAGWRGASKTGMPIVSLNELEASFGVPPTLLALLRPHLTVFSDRDPDTTTHDPVVARALSAAGLAAGAGTGGADSGVVSVTADAFGRGRTQFASCIIVEVNAQAEEHRYHVLSYEILWTEGQTTNGQGRAPEVRFDEKTDE